MEILRDLSPAETLIILDHKSTRLTDLMKVTLMDLFFKKVLKIKTINEDGSRPILQVTTSKKYNFYSPNKHELIFLNPFKVNPTRTYAFEIYIEIAYESLDEHWSYDRLIRKNKTIAQYFKQGLLTNVLSRNLLNKKGEHLQKEMLSFFIKTNEDIPSLSTSELNRLLAKIGGNRFLLSNLKSELLNKIDRELLIQENDTGTRKLEPKDHFERYMEAVEDIYLDNYLS